ncbi:beta-mannosidase [Gracilibacillus boraciitolerans JCM 21714]|uniref:beta-mannosidase n=1 Tax=Gracilibacillus boraciitolerans JCM 21714 TaxID=1298598 RepID=W4VFG7_9BACI|nr:beta-mannosidase [Gracilibacillus boraciitolerans JCM 21714]
MPAVNDHSEDGEVGENKLSVFARKAPYHYGWDWGGPRFVTSGIWKDVYLQGWSVVNITDFHIQQSSISTEVAQLTAVLEIKSTVSKEITIEIKDTDSERAYETYKLEKGTNSISVPITIAHPKLWWTRELGEQNLYTFYANILDEDDILAEVSVQTGLRQIQLIRNKDKYGTTFQFELNGIPIFAKGANHIPNDSFQTDVTEERYRHEIATAAASNMNMLRVWGWRHL